MDHVFTDLEDLAIRLGRTRTWGGLETDAVYGPAVPPERIGAPGEFPYTRGAYPQMYRSRMWTLRNIVGYGAPEDTRDGLTTVIENGGTGIDVVVDPLTTQNIDPDHPAFEAEIGLDGCSLPTARDGERLLAGVDMTRVDVAWHWALMAYPMAAAIAVRKGHDLSALQGSHMPDMLQQTLCGWGPSLFPAGVAHKAALDAIEFCARTSPRWALGMPQAYDLRERGLSPVGEIAVGMAIVKQTLRDLTARGLPVDQVAPRIAWVSTADIDLFEEVAKFRALRRLWARTLRDEFGATDPRSLRLRIACHTSGKSLIYRQPLNNLTRTAVQSLAAILGGVQSLEACTYDEPVGVPTHEARDLAIRQQQIIANETGVARVADPLGGSWYVEDLTDRVEAAAVEMLSRIEEQGTLAAIESGYVESLMDDHNLAVQKELDAGERVVIGLNRHLPDAAEPAPQRFFFDREGTRRHVARFRQLKEARDTAVLHDRIAVLHRVARDGGNPFGPMIDALVADASVAEVWGTVRMGQGMPYDPYGVLSCPFDHLAG
ncbi:MAG: methylmalonyl-CoA mutase family protein [Sagittula sp.]|uniref:methylmalonyl-CoA mutase family protein n=1 Tax=Sagittula sp. TaxID=2038081 RepID=UPI00405850B6